MPLRLSLRFLAALATLAACQRPPPAQEAPAPAAQQAPPAAAPQPAPAATPAAPPPSRRAPMPHHDVPAAPEGESSAPQVLLLKDSGVRCITHPCPSYSVQVQGAAGPREVHELDLSALPSDAERERVQEGLQRGVRVEGTVSVRRKAGPAGDATVLRVTRLLK